VTASSRSVSLAARLVLLFVLGSSAIMASAGYALYHALRMQLDAQNVAEMTGKTEVVKHILRDITSRQALEANLDRLHDISVGHPHLSIGVLSGRHWLIPPGDEALTVAAQQAEFSPQALYVETRIGARSWWLHRVEHRWGGAEPGRIDVVLFIETTNTNTLLREHAAVAILVVVLGTLASALLAWFVARRGLAPLAQVAARAEEVTAQRLGARLDVKDAPREVHGMADSINRMLERLEQSFHGLEQFSADIAHELRTPINNLLLQTQVTLSRPRPSAEYQETLHSNLTELERLQKMVSEMLFLARADRRMLELATDDIDLAAESASVGEYFEAAMADRSQSLEISGAARMRGDRSMFRRALTNLMSNAVRYSPAGARVRIEIASSDGETTVAVSNPGKDIPSAELKRLFSRFARRDESRTRDTEGAGLGLSIVDSIMQLQGGTLAARSEGGVITFILRFPAQPANSRPPAPSDR